MLLGSVLVVLLLLSPFPPYCSTTNTDYWFLLILVGGECCKARITNRVRDCAHTIATIRGTNLLGSAHRSSSIGSASNCDCFPVRLLRNVSHRHALLDLSKHSMALLPRIRNIMVMCIGISHSNGASSVQYEM